MKHDSRLSPVLPSLPHMAEQDGPMTPGALGLCPGANPVVVRRTMGRLRAAGLVTVSLRRLREALREPAIVAIGNRNEPPEGAFAQAEARLPDRFADVTLAGLAGGLR